MPETLAMLNFVAGFEEEADGFGAAAGLLPEPPPQPARRTAAATAAIPSNDVFVNVRIGRDTRRRGSRFPGSDARGGADPGDVEAGGRDRRGQDAVRVALVVVRLLVHQHRLAGQAVQLGQELRHGDREAQVHERLGDPAAADAEGPVPRHAGDDALARVDDAEVVQARDVDPVADQLGQLLGRLRLAARDRERVGRRAPVPQRRGRRVPGRLLATAGDGRGTPVPDYALEHAVADELDPPLGTALEVERLREAARVERVVGEREALVEDLLAEL